MDGTLLLGDLGETYFFARLLQNSGFFSPDPASWDYHEGEVFELNSPSSAVLSAYLQLGIQGEDSASFLEAYKAIAGTTPQEMRAFTTALLDAQVPVVPLRLRIQTEKHPRSCPIRFGARLRPFMQQLAADLRTCGARVWIVSATMQYLCEGVGDRLEIPRERVRAVLVAENTLQVLRFPWRETKVDALREAGIYNPLLVFGDTMGDAAMLAQAQYPIVMANSVPELLTLAAEKNWHILDPGA
ncbi:MAG: haloacid dehalogenase-like hydrolase [Anaerolineales bacterium]|nr:haloacid dehalogenase-like hydrolase [Anaerolineales bacterium]